MRTILAISLFTLMSTTFAYVDVIRLGVTKESYESPIGKRVKDLYRKVFDALDLEMKVVILPEQRLAAMVALGKVDAEFIRADDYHKLNDKLVKVTEPSFNFALAAYALKPAMKVKNFEEISKKRVGFRKGMEVIEIMLKGMTENLKSRFVKVENGLRLLDRRRIDYYIGVEKLTDNILRVKNNNFQNSFFKKGILMRQTAHMFLGPRVAHLEPKISKLLYTYKNKH